MKKHLLRPFAVLLGVVLAAAAPSVMAQDDGKPESAEKEESEEKGESEGGEESEPQEFDAEEFKQQLKEQEEEEKAQVATMMKVFKPLEAEWTGTEKIEHEDEPLKALDKSWKDEWKGFYTFGGRYFEMTGQASGKTPLRTAGSAHGMRPRRSTGHGTLVTMRRISMWDNSVATGNTSSGRPGGRMDRPVSSK